MDWWREFDVAFEKQELLTIGHCSDGDARLRAADFFIMRESMLHARCSQQGPHQIAMLPSTDKP